MLEYISILNGVYVDVLPFNRMVPHNYSQCPSVSLAKQSNRCEQFIKNYFIETNPLQGDKDEISNKIYMNNGIKYFMFSSPNFPNAYLKDINCVKIIKAPTPDHIIQIQFRKNFELESSQNCVNDYIEVRDGKYGFSEKILRKCGVEDEQNSIKSTGQYLWLNFRSDNQIERNGFQAIFHFIEKKSKADKRNYEFVKEIELSTDEMVVNQEDIRSLWKNKKPIVEKRYFQVEFYIEIRSKRNTPFLVTLQFSKFEEKDPKCKFNFIDVHSGLTLEAISHEEKKPSDLPFRACNKPSLAPKIINFDDFGVVRIVLGPYFSKNALGSYWSENMVNFTLVLTTLYYKPCANDKIECMKPSNESIKNPLTTEDLSVVEEHHVDKPESSILEGERETEQTLIHGPHPVYCIAKELFCNQHWNCPDKEDEEEMCSQETFQNVTEKDQHIHYPGTSTASTMNNRMTKEAHDYLQHYIIIASLLAFCAICGITSGVLTWIHRMKLKSHKKEFTGKNFEIEPERIPDRQYELTKLTNSLETIDKLHRKSILDMERVRNEPKSNHLLRNSIKRNHLIESETSNLDPLFSCENLLWQDHHGCNLLSTSDDFKMSNNDRDSSMTAPTTPSNSDNEKNCNCHAKMHFEHSFDTDTNNLNDFTNTPTRYHVDENISKTNMIVLNQTSV